LLIEADVAFLFIGGAHQVYHLAPVAAALSNDEPNLIVQCLCCDDETEEALSGVKRSLASTRLRITRVAVPRAGVWLARLLRRRSAEKGPLLMRMAFRLRGARAIVVPERTSAVLRYFGWRRLLIHFRHGAGDRAPRSERRLKAFDLIVVPGEKDAERAIQVHHVDPKRVRVGGYVKLDYLSATLASPKGRLFDDARPVVVYNPHFDPRLSSWPMAEQVVAKFLDQDRYNLVFAPHVRVTEDLSPDEIAGWHRLARPGRVIVDLGSPRLLDMSYLRGADVYLGDMSSQLYEFLVEPRPAAFLNAHGVSWRQDQRYAGWHLGEVVERPEDVIAAIDRAVAGHALVAAEQEAAVRRAFGEYRGASKRGARFVAESVRNMRGTV